MNFLVINTKGGSGKSTTAQQLLAPFLFKESNNKVLLIEYDEENQDSLSFNSEIFYSKREHLSNLENSIIDNFTNANFKNVVIDVGGNISTSRFIDALNKTSMYEFIDAVFIPFGDGEQDCINAIATYQQIKELKHDLKFFFVLSRVNYNSDLELQFIDFFGDTRGIFNNSSGYIEEIEPNDRNILKIFNDDVIKYSRLFGITVYELSLKDINNLKSKMISFSREGKTDKVRKVAYKLTMVNKAKDFVNSCLLPAWNEIKQVLNK